MQLRSTMAWLGLCPLTAGQYLIGYGFFPYDPLCGESCLRSFTSYTLACTPPMDMTTGGGHSMAMTPPSCYAMDEPFLTSVAWCLNSKCAEGQGLPTSRIEGFWEKFITGSGGSVPAKWSYSEALAAVETRPPAWELDANVTILNATAIVNPESYLAQWNVLGVLVDESKLESTYGLVILFVALATPIVFTLFGYLPFFGAFLDKVQPYIVYPSLIGTYHVRPLPFNLGNAPTVGQALFIVAFFILNVTLATVNYTSRQPNAWFTTSWREINAYVLYRTGNFGFVLLTPLLLFSSRNNILLWLTDWSHSTFLLLHRWVARIFTLYVVVHSIIGLQAYAYYATQSWWIWGAVATIAAVLLTLGSGLYVRTARYELFLISHVVLAVFVLIGCWYHLFQWYIVMALFPPYTWGYEIWLYMGIAFWAFDRGVRVLRVLKNGVHRARVTDMGAGYVRVDIPGVHWDPTPGRHVYASFPTLDPLRPWENHPFSVLQTARLPPLGVSSSLPPPRETKCAADEESQIGERTPSPTGAAAAPPRSSPAGLTLLIKKEAGITKHLGPRDGLLTLLDGPYANTHPTGLLLRCDRLLLVAGGIGITGVLPWAFQHHNVKLAWGVSEAARCLVGAVNLAGVSEHEVRIGSRFDVRELVQYEAEAGWGRVGVVVAGPGGLCDDVRAAVAAVGRRGGTVFELEVDAYSW